MAAREEAPGAFSREVRTGAAAREGRESLREGRPPMTSTTEARDLARQRSEAYRDRKRRGVVLAWIEVEARELAALERLALLEAGERDPYRIACAVAQFLKAAPAVAGMGDALWPAQAGDE